MVKLIKAEQRHYSDFGWLQTYWLFSFSDYYDPENIQFGALRVFNDDVVQPGTGFPTHPHHEMEIVTIVLSGEITHRDSMGNQAVIKAGDVQRMSAGTGLTHSEFNLGREPVHFCQIWLYPDVRSLKPTYDQRHYSSESWTNRLLPVASGQGFPDTVTFHTDATIYRAEMERDFSLDFPKGDNRRVFLYVTAGKLLANGWALEAGDQARIDLEPNIQLLAQAPTNLVLIDVPSCRGWGYDAETLHGQRA